MSSKSGRKFRLRDKPLLSGTYEQATQIKSKLEDSLTDDTPDLEALPMSVIPSVILYDLSLAYISVYDKLLAEELIASGNTTKSNSLH